MLRVNKELGLRISINERHYIHPFACKPCSWVYKALQQYSHRKAWKNSRTLQQNITNVAKTTDAMMLSSMFFKKEIVLKTSRIVDTWGKRDKLCVVSAVKQEKIHDHVLGRVHAPLQDVEHKHKLQLRHANQLVLCVYVWLVTEYVRVFSKCCWCTISANFHYITSRCGHIFFLEVDSDTSNTTVYSGLTANLKWSFLPTDNTYKILGRNGYQKLFRGRGHLMHETGLFIGILISVCS